MSEETEVTEPQETQTETPVEQGKTLLNGAAEQVSSSPETADPKEETKEEQETKEPVVPEKYELKFAEGVTVDEEALNEFTPVAKDLKLTNEQAQKLADVYANRMQKAVEAQRANYMQTVSRWAEDAKADPEIGGANLKGAVDSSLRALKTYDPDGAFAKLMDQSGFGNHPAVIRFCARIGKELKEDTLEKGASKTGKSAAQILYDKSQLS